MAVHGQEKPSSQAQVDRAALEKKIADLECTVAILEKELGQLRKELKAETTVRIVRLVNLNVDNAVKALKAIYGHRPGFEVEAFTKQTALIIRADEKTMKEVQFLLSLFH